jgi:hypothetical protein
LKNFIYLRTKTNARDVAAVIDLAERIGAISAYAYLGDVYDSITGDKKAQKFEGRLLERIVRRAETVRDFVPSHICPPETLLCSFKE